MNYTRIEKYINTFEPINEGRRNKALHNAGLLLRKNFGLTGDAMVSALSEVNQSCRPPLSDAEPQTKRSNTDCKHNGVGWVCGYHFEIFKGT